MRAFYLAWTDEVENLQRSVGEFDRQILQRSIGESSPSGPPAAVAQIPWGQNIELITKLKNPLRRLWYAEQTTANGWSRNMLVHWMESDLYSRQGKAVTSFKNALPQATSFIAITPFRFRQLPRVSSQTRDRIVRGFPWRQSRSAGNPVPVAPIAGLRLSGGQYLAKQCIS